MFVFYMLKYLSIHSFSRAKQDDAIPVYIPGVNFLSAFSEIFEKIVQKMDMKK